MALMKCGECGTEISREAATCPKCGAPNKSSPVSGAKVIAGLIVLAVVAWWLFGGGAMNNPGTDAVISQVNTKVSDDAIAEYNFVKKQGDKAQTCFEAGSVVAAFLQAKDQANYSHWKGIEHADCTAAGMPSE